MAKATVTVVFDKTRKIAEALREVSTTRVMAGVPAEKGLRQEEDGKQAGINNAALMYIHEHGAPDAGIPPRPVVYPAIKSIHKEVVKTLFKIGRLALEGKPKQVEQGFNALGIMAQNAMRKRITDGPFIPDKPATLAARRARGHKGERPLIETGQLRRALTYVIRKI